MTTHEFRNILSALSSDKQKDRSDALDKLKSHGIPSLIGQEYEENLRALVLTLAAAMEKEKSDYISKLKKSNATATVQDRAAQRLTRFANELNNIIQSYANFLVDCTQDIVAHVLALLPYHKRLLKPIASPYTRILSKIFVTPCTRYSLMKHADIVDQTLQLCIHALKLTENVVSVTAVEVELARVLSKVVVCLPQSPKNYYSRLHGIFCDFFQSHSDESSCHLPLLSCLNFYILDLTRNAADCGYQLVADLFASVLKLWNTKNHLLKTEVVSFLRLAIFIVFGDDLNSDVRNNRLNRFLEEIEILYNLLWEELRSTSKSNLWIPILSTSIRIQYFASMNYQYPQRELCQLQQSLIFQFINDGALEKYMFSWKMLDLFCEVTDCLWHLQNNERADNVDANEYRNGEVIGTKRIKKVKRTDILDDISSLLKSNPTKEAIPAILNVLQSMCLMLLKPCSFITPASQIELSFIISELMKGDHVDIQNWSMITLACSLYSIKCNDQFTLQTSTTELFASPQSQSLRELCTKVWDIALRKIGIPAVSSCAFLLLRCIIRHPLMTDSPEECMQLMSAVPPLSKLMDPKEYLISLSLVMFVESVLRKGDIGNLESPKIIEDAMFQLVVTLLSDDQNNLINFNSSDLELVLVCMGLLIGIRVNLRGARQALPVEDEVIHELRFVQFKFVSGTLDTGTFPTAIASTDAENYTETPSNSIFASSLQSSIPSEMLKAILTRCTNVLSISSDPTSSKKTSAPNTSRTSKLIQTLVTSLYTISCLLRSKSISIQYVNESPIVPLLFEITKVVIAELDALIKFPDTLLKLLEGLQLLFPLSSCFKRQRTKQTHLLPYFPTQLVQVLHQHGVSYLNPLELWVDSDSSCRTGARWRDEGNVIAEVYTTELAKLMCQISDWYTNLDGEVHDHSRQSKPLMEDDDEYDEFAIVASTQKITIGNRSLFTEFYYGHDYTTLSTTRISILNVIVPSLLSFISNITQSPLYASADDGIISAEDVSLLISHLIELSLSKLSQNMNLVSQFLLDFVDIESVSSDSLVIPYLSSDDLIGILQHFADVLENPSVADIPWIWVSLIRCFAAVLPNMIRNVNSSEPSSSKVRKQLRKIYRHLKTGYLENEMPPFVRLEFAEFIIHYLRWDPAQSILSSSSDSSQPKEKSNRSHSPTAIMMALIHDPDVNVRLAMVKIISAFFSMLTNPEDQIELYNDIRNQLQNSQINQTSESSSSPNGSSLKPCDTLEHAMTNLMILCEILVCSEVNRSNALIDIVSFGHQSPDKYVIRNMIQDSARRIGYESASKLLSQYFPDILSAWVKCHDEPFHETAFPVGLFDCDSMSELIARFGGEIITAFLPIGKSTQLRAFLQSNAQDISSICKKHFPQIMSFSLPYYFGTNQERKVAESIDQFVQSFLDKRTVNEEWNRHWEEITRRVIRLFFEPSVDYELLQAQEQVNKSELEKVDANLRRMLQANYSNHKIYETMKTSFSASTVTRCIAYMNKAFNPESSENCRLFSYFTPSRCQPVIQDIHEDLDLAKSKNEKYRLLSIYRFVVSCMPVESILHPFIFQYMIQTLIKLIVSDERIGVECCGILSYLCSIGMADVDEFIRHIPLTVSLITEQLMTLVQLNGDNETEARLNADQRQKSYGLAQEKLMETFQRIVDFCASSDSIIVVNAANQIPPFPDHPIFDHARSILSSIQARNKKNDSINRLLPFFDSKSTTAKLASIRHLRDEIKRSKLLQAPSSHDAIRQVICKLIISCPSQTEVSKVDESEECFLQICRTLGEISSFVDLSSVRLRLDNQVTGMKNGKSLEDIADAIVRGKVTILLHLSNCAMDPDVHIARRAVKTLRAVLQTQSGLDAYSHLDHVKSRQLELFKATAKFRLSRPKADISDIAIWMPGSGTHDEWIKSLTLPLIASVSDDFLKQLGHMVGMKPRFGELILPYLVYALLISDYQSQCLSQSSSFRAIISRGIREAFKHYENHSKESLQTLLSIVIFLRKQSRPSSKNFFENNLWLDLDFLNVAKAAQYCHLHVASLMFVETWVEFHRDEITLRDDIYVDLSDVPSYQLLLSEIYRGIGEPDGFYGVGKAVGLNALMSKYDHERAWQKNFELYESSLHSNQFTAATKSTNQSLSSQRSSSSSSAGPQANFMHGMLDSMSHLGYNHLTSMYFRGLKSALGVLPSDLQELQHQALWRTAQWDEDVIGTAQQPGLHTKLYSTFKSLYSNDPSSFKSNISQAYMTASKQLKSEQLQSATSVQTSLLQLSLIREVEEAGILMNMNTIDDIRGVFAAWDSRLQFLNQNQTFNEVEQILALRTSLLKLLRQKLVDRPDSEQFGRHRINVVNQYYKQHLCRSIRLARKSGQVHVASNCLKELKDVVPSSVDNIWKSLAIAEEAKLLWFRGERNMAILMLKAHIRVLDQLQFEFFDGIVDISSPKNSTSKQSFLSKIFRRTGEWTAELRSENPRAILEKYLEASAKRVDTSVDGPGSFHTLARYCDEQYQLLLKSDTLASLRELQEHKKKELADYKKLTGVQRIGGAITKLEAQIQLDQEDIASFEESKNLFLLKAVQNYAHSLVISEKNNLSVFRLCSLWLENYESKDVNRTMEEALLRIPTRKFVLLIYQLSARIGSDDQRTDFQRVLLRLVTGMAADHPHHVLWQVLALYYNNVINYSSSSMQRESVSDKVDQKRRIDLAGSIIGKLKSDQKLLGIVTQYEDLCDAYMQLCYHVVSDSAKKAGKMKLDRRFKLGKMNNLDLVPVPSIQIPVDPTGAYSDMVTIASFKPECYFVGGVNTPKKLECVGSDGKIYLQLAKGNDDLRQDGTLMQIFQIVDLLLKNHSTTRKRNLGIRIYKVIPLAPKAGLLEWVDHTIPLGKLLSDCYKQYNSNGIDPMQIRNMMYNEHKRRGSTRKSKIDMFRNQILAQFKPVFRHWFSQTFKDPDEWFEKRLSYVRSCAASSIVGYMVGLGDRHTQNILVDATTAELIQIDLGISFDQGRLLAVPEMVPFRLTQNMVDGMGITGVDGTFRRCCEETMRVLRRECNVIYTILEVFMYDPLYNWTITPQKLSKYNRGLDDSSENGSVMATRRHHDSSSSSPKGNREAKRALLGVQKKLNTDLSIECQVNELITEAQNDENLAVMYFGWASWL
ncbi:hypothetical protein BKA69DRAFT_1055444 [Paraphysoderma sedebokerense]|nr:hypothetical protein BKA69DRAFT_1055444 [Paraphysoderma sedebokerense]